jgi:cerevisin
VADAYRRLSHSGVNINHVELEGRATWGKTMPKDTDVDANGHGSHVAGTIASAKYGVAKDANIIAVKVLGSSGSGSMLDVVGGVAWAAQQASSKMQSQAAKNGTHKGSVAVSHIEYIYFVYAYTDMVAYARTCRSEVESRRLWI